MPKHITTTGSLASQSQLTALTTHPPQDSFTRHGVLYKPTGYSVFCDGEPLEVFGMAASYSYLTASHIVEHLKAVSNRHFEIKPIAWKAQ